MCGCHRRVREITARAGYAHRACKFPYGTSSCGDGGVAGAVGYYSILDFDGVIEGDDQELM